MSNCNSSTPTPKPGEAERLAALDNDPALRWLRDQPRTWIAGLDAERVPVTTALIRAVAGGIAMTAWKNMGRGGRALARDLFLACFVPPRSALGRAKCRAIYATVLREIRAADRHHRVRDMHKLSGSYARLEALGVPAPVAGKCRRDGESLSARAASTVPPERIAPPISAGMVVVLEEELETFDYPADRVIFHPTTNTFRMQYSDGEWSDPMSEAGLKNRLRQLGIMDREFPGFIARTRHYDHLEPVFDSNDDLVVRGGRVAFNTYRGATVRPEPGAWPDIRTVLLSVCNGDGGLLEYLLDWIAKPLQSLYDEGEPHLNRTAFATNGLEGTGKNTLQELLVALYGKENCVTLGQADIDGRFNGQVHAKLFCFMNEVVSSSNRSAETANKLKTWIADRAIPIERKGKDTINAENHMNCLLASNDDALVIISKTDRRYTVSKATKKPPREVFDRVYADLKGPQRQLAGFYHYLLHRKIQHRTDEVYETDARKEVQKHTMPSEERFAHDIAEDGWLSVAKPWQAEVPPHLTTTLYDMVHDRAYVCSGTMAAAYSAYCRRFGLKQSGVTKLAAAVKRAIPDARPDCIRLGKDRTKARGYWGIPIGGNDENPFVDEVQTNVTAMPQRKAS